MRTDEASLQLRGTVSRASATWPQGEEVGRLDASGVTVGPAVVRAWGDLSLALGVGLAARSTSTRVGDLLADSAVTVDTLVTGDAFWRPGQRAQLYTQLALGAAAPSLWVRAGGIYPVTPRDAIVAAWLGAEATTSGALPTLATEVGPVLELPIRPLAGSLALRASAPIDAIVAGDALSDRTTLGLAAYWAWRE